MCWILGRRDKCRVPINERLPVVEQPIGSAHVGTRILAPLRRAAIAGRLVLSEAQVPQPDHNVHVSAHSALLNIIMQSGERVQEAPKRVRLAV
jgi:hypothetical protein